MFGLLTVGLVAALPILIRLSDSLYASAKLENLSKLFKLTHASGFR